MPVTYLIPEMVLFAAGVILSLWPCSRKKTLLSALLVLVILTASLFGFQKMDLFSGNYAWDGLSLYFSILILASSFFVTLLGYSGALPAGVTYRKFILLVFSLASILMFLAGTQNMVFFLILWSLGQILFFLLYRKAEAKPAWNILILDFVSTLIFLIGVILLYALSGALNLVEIKTSLIIGFFREGPPGKILPLTLILITAGLLFKLGAFPFYFWMRGLAGKKNLLPYIIYSLLVRLGLLAFAIRFWLRSVTIYPEGWQFILIIAALGSLLWGGLALLIWRKEDKSWLYLDLMQTGYLLSGIALATSSGLTGTLFYLWGYLFALWGLALSNASPGEGDFEFKPVLTGWKSGKFRFLALAYFFFSLIGLPFTAGFWGKYDLIYALLKEKNWVLMGSVVLATLLLIGYLITVWKERGKHPVSEVSGVNSWPLYLGMSVCVIAILLAGLFPEVILNLVLAAAGSIPF